MTLRERFSEFATNSGAFRPTDLVDAAEVKMKRTALKRSTKPIARGKKPNAKRPGKARRVSVVRDRKYLDWLKDNCCCVVGNPVHRKVSLAFCDPAHGPVNGMSSKGPDTGAIPLCRMHHDEQHALTWPAFESKYGIDRAAIAAEHYARFKSEAA